MQTLPTSFIDPDIHLLIHINYQVNDSAINETIHNLKITYLPIMSETHHSSQPFANDFNVTPINVNIHQTMQPSQVLKN